MTAKKRPGPALLRPALPINYALRITPELLQERVPVPIVPEEVPALDPAHHDVLEGAPGVNASLTRHTRGVPYGVQRGVL